MGYAGNTQKRYGAFSSSVDPQKLSRTVKGALRSISAILIILAPFLGVDVGDINSLFNSLGSFVDALMALVATGLAVWGAGEVVFGAIRKILVAKGVKF